MCNEGCVLQTKDRKVCLDNTRLMTDDDSRHWECQRCGYCRTCGDCEQHGCGVLDEEGLHD